MSKKQPKLKPFSVLLMYPDYVSDYGESYYGWVRAENPVRAARAVQMRASRAYWRRRGDAGPGDIESTADDFAVHLVLHGHRKGLRWW